MEVDSKIIGVEPQPDERLTKALASAGATLVRLEPPRFVVSVKAASESESERQAVEALERWAPGAGAGWSVAGVTLWEDDWGLLNDESYDVFVYHNFTSREIREKGYLRVR